MKKKILALLPLLALLAAHIAACWFLVFTEQGRDSILLVLVTFWFWLALAGMLFYGCGWWAARRGARPAAGRVLLALVSGTLYAAVFPFFLCLQEFLAWGHPGAFVHAPTWENILFVLIPFLLSAVPCLIGQVVGGRR